MFWKILPITDTSTKTCVLGHLCHLDKVNQSIGVLVLLVYNRRGIHWLLIFHQLLQKLHQTFIISDVDLRWKFCNFLSLLLKSYFECIYTFRDKCRKSFKPKYIPYFYANRTFTLNYSRRTKQFIITTSSGAQIKQLINTGNYDSRLLINVFPACNLNRLCITVYSRKLGCFNLLYSYKGEFEIGVCRTASSVIYH